MPIYEVYHSYPLNGHQRALLAERITHLHSTAFLTPSIFVHVRFQQTNASGNDYYLAGKLRTTGSTNRISAMVRTSEKRTKQHWDDLAAKIEDAWHEAVSGEKIEEGQHEGKRKEEVDDTDTKREAKKLLVVAFYAMVGARENGHTIPVAGGEAEWFQELKPEFQRRADAGDEDYKAMLEEVESRDDLKKAYGA